MATGTPDRDQAKTAAPEAASHTAKIQAKDLILDA
jgi:hypothetical protein